MHVCTRLPGSCSTPVRRSRTCPSSSPTTHDWQIPIRQPNGICTPALFARLHQRRRGVHGDRLPASCEFHRAALAVHRGAGRREALQMKPLADTLRRPGLLGGVEHAFRAARPASAGPASRALRRRAGTGRAGPARGSRAAAADSPSGRLCSSASSAANITSDSVGAECKWTMSVIWSRRDERAQHRHHRRDAGARR